MRGQAILCVDDEAIILLAMKRELKDYFGDRFQFETALNADEGLRVLDELEDEGLDVQVVISDWLMPGMKGDEFLSRVRASRPRVGAIMVTGHADPDSLARLARDLGPVAVIRKPWGRVELVSAVDACLGPAPAT